MVVKDTFGDFAAIGIQAGVTELTGRIVYDTETLPWSSSPAYGFAQYWSDSNTLEIGDNFSWSAGSGGSGIVVQNDRLAGLNRYDMFEVSEGGYASFAGKNIYMTASVWWKDNLYASLNSINLPAAEELMNFNVNESYFSMIGYYSGQRAWQITVVPVAWTITSNDSDGDGVPDDRDICPNGDDTVDTDADGVPDNCDVCPNDFENDADGDGICGDVDICPGGVDSLNTDGDSLPDFCDVCPLDPENDADGDGVCESDDNCPIVANPSQFNFDGDALGNECDPDDDNDGVLDANDECLGTIINEVVNKTGCSVADLCPCENSWKNHGAYVSCVAHTTEDFVEAGLITGTEKDALVSEAGTSNCGTKK